MFDLESTIRKIVRDEIAQHAPEPPPAASTMPEVMTSSQAAIVLQCTRQHVNDLAKAGALKSKWDGGRRIYLRDWVLEFMHNNKTAASMPRADRVRLSERRA